MRLTSAAVTDTGLARARNEDALLELPERGLFAVADGMGGHTAGDVASALALETFARELETGANAADDPDSDLAGGMRDAVLAANRALLERGERDPALAGMGTTLTAAGIELAGSSCTIAHIGDSRAYLLRGRELEQLTIDHTVVQREVLRGAIPARLARTHPMRHLLTRALGMDPEPEVELRRLALREGDTLLLCSDGLTGMVDDADLLAILRAGSAPSETVARLVEAANGGGGEDNITAVVVRIDQTC